MRAAALALLLGAAALASGDHSVPGLSKFSRQFIQESRHQWRRFKQNYNKSYSDVDEERMRYYVFTHNLNYIAEHNAQHVAGGKRHRLAVNHLADLSHDEYRRMNGFKRNYGDSLAKPHASHFMAPMHSAALPRMVDWRDHNMVTDVKNQGMCGSCWSFSTTGALEGQHARRTGKLVSLSEQNLVDCSTSYGNHGCNGGLMDQAFQYIRDNGGVDTELSYPYEGKEGECRFRQGDVGARDTGFTDVQSGDEDALQQAVATVGPVSVAIDASHRSFQFYDGDVYYEPECSAEQLDHGVLAVGYGSTDEGKDYWLVKNSWGPRWGERGYIKMARNEQNMCGIATAASYPLV